MQTGDKVRFLNDVGGGVITRIEGKLAYVEGEDGFETPVPLNELVVVLPAGYDQTAEAKVRGRMMFDQKAFDAGKRTAAAPVQLNVTPEPQHDYQPQLPVEETGYGDKLNVLMAFEPTDLKHLSQSKFAMLLINDSNYFLAYSLMARPDDKSLWQSLAAGVMEPNMQDELKLIAYDELNNYACIAFQCIAYKQDKPFALKRPVSSLRKPDLSKFYKLHCFRPNRYSDTPVLEIPIIENDVTINPLEVDEVLLAENMGARIKSAKENDKDFTRQLKEKYNVRKPKVKNPADNPHRLLPPIEVDLHIGQLTDTTAGMTNADMLELQLSTVRKTMEQHRRRLGQKIIFIHGKGEGVLRKAVLDLLKKEYPKAELQDASFREYGFGATLVTLH